MTVAPGPVVGHFNVIEDICTGQITGFVYSLPDVFFFQCIEERFGHRIIPAVATSIHARSKAIRPAEAQPVFNAVLTTLNAMKDDLTIRFSTPVDHHQRIDCEFA